jgi:hypothetical protein
VELKQIMEQTTPEAQVEALRVFLAVDPENASAGKLFSAYRQKRLGLAETDPAHVSGIKDEPKLSRAMPDGKMADGAVSVTAAPASVPGMTVGKYLAEDKTGKKPYDPKQAERYSAELDRGSGTYKAPDGTQFKGLVYFFENQAAADKAFVHANGLNPNVHLAYFDEHGVLRWRR